MSTLPELLGRALTDDEDARVCLDIPEAACDEQPRAFALQLLAQMLGKLADTLSSSRVVLPWLLGSIAAPAAFIAWLVPLRESLSLLPQLAIAARLRAQPLRRGYYVLGAVLQGLCLLLMPAILLLPGPSASAAALLLLLAAYSLARGICSVASKDVLGKTVSKRRRGRLTGLAGSIAGLFGVGLALALLIFGAPGSGTQPLLVLLLLGAAGCWFGAAGLYRQVPERPGATEGGGNALREALASIGLLRSDRVFRNFVIARMLLVASAYAIPYLVVIAQQRSGAATATLAAVLLAEGLAALSSAYFWGLWSDRASHYVMTAAALLTAIVLGIAELLLNQAPAALANPLLLAVLLYTAAVAHQGARVGRKTYLVDIATSDTRASYVAVSNTVLGAFMLAGGGLGFIDARFGIAAVLALLLAMALAAAFTSYRLPQAQ